MKQRIIITGANGYIAKQLIKRIENAYELLLLSSTESIETIKLDLQNVDDFNFDLIHENDIILHLAAISSPDICKTEFAKAFSINVIGTIQFIETALKKGAKVLFFSTDAIYGKQEDVNDENTPPLQPLGEYPIMKRVVEQYFEGSTGLKIFRLSYVFSWDDKFMGYLHACRDSGKKVEVFPFYRKMIYIKDVLDCIINIINKWNAIEQVIFNICGEELVSRLNIAQLYNAIVGPIDYALIDPPVSFFEARAQTVFVKSTTIEALLGRKVLSIREAMEIENSKK